MDYDEIILRSKDPELKAQLREQKRRYEQLEERSEIEAEINENYGRESIFGWSQEEIKLGRS